MDSDLHLADTLVNLGHIKEARLQELQHAFEELAPQTPLDAQLLIANEIDELPLLEAMQTAYEIPFLDPETLSNINTKSALIFPRELAQRHQIVPYGTNNDGLLILSAHPLEKEAIRKIQQRTKLKLESRLTTSIRVAQLLKKLYATPLPTFATGKLTLPSPEKVKIQKVPPPPVELAPPTVPLPFDWDAVINRIDNAVDRDGILNSILAAAQSCFSFASLFRIRNNRIIGWRCLDLSYAPGLQQIDIDLEHPSIFQTIHQTGGHYLGPLAPSDCHEQMLSALELPQPAQVLALPIRIGTRVSVVLYCSQESALIEPDWIAPFVDLTSRARWALEQIIRNRKSQTPPPVEHRKEKTKPVGPSPVKHETAETVETTETWHDIDLDLSSTLSSSTQVFAGPPPSVTWQNVIAEARNAANLVPRPKSFEIRIAGAKVDERELLLADLLSADSQIRREAFERLLKLGPAVDELFRDRFPGKISFNPLTEEVQLPPFGQCSGLLEYIEARGPSASSIVLPHLENSNALSRFFALYFLHTVHVPEGLEASARRLYDSEPAIRYMAAETIRKYRDHPAYTQIIDGLIRQLRVPVHEIQVAAIQVLGQLREKTAVPALIPLLVAPHSPTVVAVASSLAVICAQELGTHVTRWASWWKRHYHEPRTTWLITGLRHSNSAIRRIACNELRMLTSFRASFDPDAPRKQREDPTLRWEAWWEEQRNNAMAASEP